MNTIILNKKIKNEKKKSQVIAYIALSLLVVILILGVILRFFVLEKEIRNLPKEEIKKNTDPRTDVIYFLKRCIMKETEKALYLAASQGNVINLSKWKNNGKNVYWFYWNESILLNSSSEFLIKENGTHYFYPIFIEKIPSLDDLKEELEPYLIKKIDECIDNFKVVRYKYDIYVSYDIEELKITFFNKSVKVKVVIPLTIYDPRENKIDKKTNEFVEEVKLPYKETYLRTKQLLEKVFSQGLYGYYLIFLTGLSDKIPYNVYLPNCDKKVFNINEIKKEIEDLLNKSHDICYFNCKFVSNPFNSFESDLMLEYPDYIETKTDILKIKYFDVFLNFEVRNPIDRYKEGNAYLKNNEIIVEGLRAEDYYGLDSQLFNKKICVANFYYDLIVEGSLSLINNELRNPLIFKVSFDFGLMNNRPITLAAFKQKVGSLSWYYTNETANTILLWPRKEETAFYEDKRKNYYFINTNLNFYPAEVNQITDLFLDLEGFYSYEFCYPFFIKKWRNKVPLISTCSDGSLVVKNKTHFLVLSKKDLNLAYENDNPSFVKVYGKSGELLVNKILNELSPKQRFNISIFFVNKQIVDIYEKEEFLNNNFVEINRRIRFNTLLSPKIYNPFNEKLERKDNVIFNFTDYSSEVLFSLLLNKDYLYGSVFSLLNSSFLENLDGLNVTTILIPVSVFGDEVKFSKVLNKKLVLPVVYDYFFLRKNENITKFLLLLDVLYDLISYSCGDSNFKCNLKFFDYFVQKIDEGVNMGSFQLDFSNEVDQITKEKIIKKILNSKVYCSLQYRNIPLYSNKEKFFLCLKELYPEIFELSTMPVYNNYIKADFNFLSEALKIKEKENENLDPFFSCISKYDVENCNILIKSNNNYKNEEYNLLLANPIYFMRQKWLENNTKNIKPFFGKKVIFRGDIDLNFNKTFYDFSYILVSKASCTNDNGKKEIYYSNYGVNNWEYVVYLPEGDCQVISKVIYQYDKIKKLKDFKIIIDNNVEIKETSKKFLYELANLLNIKLEEGDPKKIIRNSFLINCSNLPDDYFVLTNDNIEFFNFLESECNHFGETKVYVVNLGTYSKINENLLYSVYPLYQPEEELALLKKFMDLLELVEVTKVKEVKTFPFYNNFDLLFKLEVSNNELEISVN